MGSNRRLSVLSGVVLFFLVASYAADAPETELKTVSVAAFKNGLGFFVKQGNAKLTNGEGRLAFVPNATLGTLWMAPNDPAVSMDELIAYHYEKTTPKARIATSLDEVLAANVGKTVTVTYNQKDYSGEILQNQKPEPVAVVPLHSDDEFSSGNAVRPETANHLLLLKVDGKVLAFNRSGISLIALSQTPNLQWTLQEPTAAKALRFKLKGAGESAAMTMGYLQKGIGWTPSYLISLKDAKTASLTMQAVITNDAEDLNNADFFFVVGFPNFAYSDTPSPMALQQSLAQMMNSMRNESASKVAYSNVNSQMMAAADSDGSAPSFSTTKSELEGSAEEDLFLYKRSGVTLAKGERATYNVFSGDISYEHIYEWEVSNRSQVDAWGHAQNQYNQSPSDREIKNNVWHSLRLKNSTKFPWTSAPTMVTSGLKPVSQDTLVYTPQGASTNLKLTIATDIRTNQEELEVARDRNVPCRHSNNCDVVTVEGKLTVKNYKTKDALVSITKKFTGAMLTASDNGKAQKLASAMEAVNPSSQVKWNVSLKPGEEKIVVYRYKVLVVI
jgi:hypothetical protein